MLCSPEVGVKILLSGSQQKGPFLDEEERTVYSTIAPIKR